MVPPVGLEPTLEGF